VLPVAEIARRARAAGAVVVVDGAQAAAHLRVDVEALGCDFYALSGHKMYGPTGIGALWGRREILEAMPPWQGGGDMILSVRFDATTYREAPHKFEAGTPHVVGAIGLGAAIDWLTGIGLDRISAREADLLRYATGVLGAIRGLGLVGTARDKVAVLSFNLGDLHAHDVGTALDLDGVAVRAGHHCAQPVMERFGLEATVRASLGVYSNEGDIDALVAAVDRARVLLAGHGAKP
jgi:cysteine desulfurase / selenocysteine lyase